MNIVLFIFLIVIAPAYLNESGSSRIQYPSVENNQSDLEAKKKANDSSESELDKCPNNKVLVQTLQVLKESLVQNDKQLSPEKFKGVLDSLIDYLSKSRVDSHTDDDKNHALALKNVVENVKNRSKKEVLRASQAEERDPNEKLSGKVTLQYNLPSATSPDCHMLFNAIINVIQAAYSQISKFCSETGGCQLNKENKKIIPDWVPPYELPYTNGENALHPKLLFNDSRQYPQKIDLLTVLQNYRPNSDIANNDNNVPDTNQEYELNNMFLSNDKPNDVTRQKDSTLEILTVLNRPSGYAKVNVDSSPSVPISPNPTLTRGNRPLQNNPLVEGAISNQLKLGNFEQLNIPSVPANVPVDDNNIQYNVRNLQVNIPPGRNPIASHNIVQKEVGYRLLPSNQNYNLNYGQQPQGNIFSHGPKLSGNQPNSAQQLIYNESPYHRGSAAHYQQAQHQPSYLSKQKQNLPNKQSNGYYKTQYFPYHQPGGQTSQQNIFYGSKQMPYSIYPGSQKIPGSLIDPRLADFYRNLNNSVGLHDLYRLSVSNGQKLNIAPNKNGVIELTFTLQRPQALEFKPLYYVKYRLPYETYMYNVQNLQNKPFLRTNTAKLYQNLLAMANITESSQDLKDLDKEEISKLVATNGALVKAKMFDDSSNSVDDIVGEEVKNILKLSSKLGPEGMLNATKIAINNIEEATAINETDQDPIDIKKSNNSHETSKSEVPSQFENPKSVRNTLVDVNVPYFRGPVNGVSYMKPNNGYKTGEYPLNRPISNPLFVPPVNY